MKCKREHGLTLVETLIAVAVFVLVSVALYGLYAKITEVTTLIRVKTIATSLANERFETIRNMPYADVGTVGGIPAGDIPQEEEVTRSNIVFTVQTTIRNIDDPFDGTLGGDPEDTSPADSKVAQVTVLCATCKNYNPLSFSSRIAPKNLETASTNGTLVIRVFDASGQPVSQADVLIENAAVDPAVSITDTTGTNGVLTIVDAPPSVEGYEITVSKDGYSTDQTHPETVDNPNPTKPHATVVEQQITQVSFTIDALSTLGVSTMTPTCDPVGNVDFSITGSKLIGTNPNVYKYQQDHSTDAAGDATISNIEWDTYTTTITDTSYNLSGLNPLTPITISPGSVQNLDLIVVSKTDPSLLVTVVDAGSGLPITDATVSLTFADELHEQVTSQGVFSQTDWSGGPGQDDYLVENQFSSSDGNIEYMNPSGEISLQDTLGVYASSGVITSSTFDTGSESNFHEVSWEPYTQQQQVGLNGVQMQIATNIDNVTWNFLGPNGTSGTYYTPSNRAISSVHSGDQYLRYRVYLSTDDTAYTPHVSDVATTFTSSCTPPGQVLFSGLSTETYNIDVQKSGYETYSGAVSVSAGWQQTTIELNPM